MNILIGTASWTDPTLLACGRFYPPAAHTPQARLQFYASRFGMAEVDASFYALPDPHTAYLWAQRTPPGFVFNIKAFRLFTGHQTPRAALPADLRREVPGEGDAVFDDQVPGAVRDELWRRYVLALEPLRQAGKLGAVHCQFAPWVRREARGVARVRDCAARLRDAGELVMAAEMRHASWFGSAAASDWTLALERDLALVHTVVDSPQGFANSVPPVWECTHPELALVRLHGRNAGAWNSRAGASSSRFQYEYSPQELAELAARVKRLAARARHTHAVFNTNYEDQGMRNAAGLAAALAPG